MSKEGPQAKASDIGLGGELGNPMVENDDFDVDLKKSHPGPLT
jgi:hypothetical protein